MLRGGGRRVLDAGRKACYKAERGGGSKRRSSSKSLDRRPGRCPSLEMGSSGRDRGWMVEVNSPRPPGAVVPGESAPITSGDGHALCTDPARHAEAPPPRHACREHRDDHLVEPHQLERVPHGHDRVLSADGHTRSAARIRARTAALAPRPRSAVSASRSRVRRGSVTLARGRGDDGTSSVKLQGPPVGACGETGLDQLGSCRRSGAPGSARGAER